MLCVNISYTKQATAMPMPRTNDRFLEQNKNYAFWKLEQNKNNDFWNVTRMIFFGNWNKTRTIVFGNGEDQF